ncbi:hypothetical protein VP01_516g4 [Puccinia sorghi]|uniref:Uncharacterized protein n=1 Tax=Puccinia sorghi TaxID=27349 RepID=A0A0L6UKW1_9BASI|nr:hypothetical protein VP01_516g4 [Puccinia sorghi]
MDTYRPGVFKKKNSSKPLAMRVKEFFNTIFIFSYTALSEKYLPPSPHATPTNHQGIQIKWKEPSWHILILWQKILNKALCTVTGHCEKNLSERALIQLCCTKSDLRSHPRLA